MQVLKTRLPDWIQDWLEVIIPGVQILLILLVAWLLQRMLRRIVRRASTHYQVPDELVVPMNGLIRWVVVASAALLVLERMGVSATVLWTAFTGFATVGAVAFFAAWSVLSNLFCALLIFTVRPFRIGDYIEVLDTAEKPGAKGRVVDINLLYTTLEDHGATAEHVAWLQIPNALVFQRVVRRFQGVPGPVVPPAVPAPAGVATAAPSAEASVAISPPPASPPTAPAP
ncbi:mechanosensitive ion channel protein MscS [Acidovorax sp. Leaf76]|uniref:mechanosensitive ion channel domain-containing protein n=1 Tax=unclassified Acidovorax TaxID=2684926 RepID=UPI0006FF48CE|nr:MULTISPECIES: mechanosensitive ion channel domain-containing protein [unclassified Acidovorax]KQO13739.1 mechanosensitive ion channel protein MscS [Acidovorax sp. Leaf76]KQO30958.1 mechanosensitive ion channel protein MscS [Acidovorax sp. Leaf84]KQS27370.1 mechanosensitive ion channel protein MscS [Acidovorax sp. Leaf191]